MTDEENYPGTAERTEESVVRVCYSSLERGELERYLRPGESIDLPADRVEVEALDDEDGEEEVQRKASQSPTPSMSEDESDDE